MGFIFGITSWFVYMLALTFGFVEDLYLGMFFLPFVTSIFMAIFGTVSKTKPSDIHYGLGSVLRYLFLGIMAGIFYIILTNINDNQTNILGMFEPFVFLLFLIAGSLLFKQKGMA